jgi:integrase
MAAVFRQSCHPRYKYEIVVTDPTRRERNGRARRITHYFHTAEAAKAKARELNLSIMAGGVSNLDLSPTVRRDTLDARALLDAAGFHAATLTEVVQEWIRSKGAGPVSRQLVTPFLDACLDAKSTRENLSPLARKNIEDRVGAWFDREAIVTLSDITRERCVALAERKGVSAQTRRNDMGAVSSFLNWLVQEGVISTNPIQGMRRPASERTTPKCYTAAECHRLLAAAAKYANGSHARAFGVLLLAGLRPSELPGSTLDLDHKTPALRVSGGKMRGRANRIVQLRQTAAAWLRAQPEPARGLELPRGPRVAIARLANVPWIVDGPRHTWISARLTVSGDENGTAREAGTSPEIIFRHYHRLMTRAEADTVDQLGKSPDLPKIF